MTQAITGLGTASCEPLKLKATVITSLVHVACALKAIYVALYTGTSHAAFNV